MFIYGNLVENLQSDYSTNNTAIDLDANEVSNEGNFKVYNNTVTNVGGSALRVSYVELDGTTIQNNWIHDNGTDESANYGGAGIWFSYQVSVPLVRNNTIYNNTIQVSAVEKSCTRR